MKTKQQQQQNFNSFCKAVFEYANAHDKNITLADAEKYARYIHRYEATLSRLAEMECDAFYYNRYWIDGVNPEQERAEARIEKFIKEKIGCECYTQRDPRGYCVRLYLKCKENNFFYTSWDGNTSAANW